MRRPSGVLFDYGNTLLVEDYFDLLAGTRRVLEFAAGEVKFSAEEIQAESRGLNEEINRVRDSAHLEFTNRNLQHTLYESLGITINLSPEEMEREFWRAAQRFTPAAGIQTVLDWLQTRGIKTGIISNCSFSGAIMREDLAKWDLERYFDFLISSADYGYRKPHPRIFQIALRKMGLPAHQVWFAGDNPECDLKGAFDAGLFPLWYNALNQANPRGWPCLEVKSWADLLVELQKLEY
jgi:putative hydrolase of the HAD superfamily